MDWKIVDDKIITFGLTKFLHVLKPHYFTFLFVNSNYDNVV
jgi:hypothetical protein